MSNKKIGLVIGGGGSKGAWGSGVVHGLMQDHKRNYSDFAGTSTGALIALLAANGETLRLKEAYTSVSDKDIYRISPYRVKRKRNGVYKTKMNIFKIAWNIFVRSQKTFGDSSKIRTDLLPKFYDMLDYQITHDLGKNITVSVTNLTTGLTEYKSLQDDGMTYEDFLDWVWASTCAAPFMSILTKNGYEYADGGYIEAAPIQTLIDSGCDEIDVILHRSPEPQIEKMRNPIHVIGRIVNITMNEALTNDILLSELEAKDKNVIINIYEPGYKLTNNELVFDKEQMLKWWEAGYNVTKQEPVKRFMVIKGNPFKKQFTLTQF